MNTNQQGDAAQRQDDSLSEMVRIALRAAYWFLFCSTLLCAVLTAFFPYGSMKVYAKLGMRNLVSETAQHVVSKQVRATTDKMTGKVTYSFKGERPKFDSKFADALYYYTLPIASQELDESIQKKGVFAKSTIKAAKKVVANGDIYTEFDSDRADAAWQSDALEYAARNYLYSAQPDLYSYKTIVRKNYMQAKYIAYNDEIPSEFVRLLHLVRDPHNLSANNMDEYAVWFAELNAVINLELDIIGYQGSGLGSNLEQILKDGVTVGSYFRYLYSKQSFTELGEAFFAGKQETLLVLEQRIQDIKSFIYTYNTGNDKNEVLRRTYWARQLSLLTQNIRIVTDILYAERGTDANIAESITALHNDWSNIYDWYSLGGTSVGRAYDWYDMILGDYEKLFELQRRT